MGKYAWVGILGIVWGQNGLDSLELLRAFRREVRRLCRYEGRGTGEKGGRQAAAYIEKRLRRLGLRPQRQGFPISVVHFSRAQLWAKVNGRWYRWRVGQAFLPAPDSPSLIGEWRVDTLPQPGQIWLAPADLKPDIALQKALQEKVACLLLRQPKLTAVRAARLGPLPVIWIRDTLPVPTHLRLRLESSVRTDSSWNVFGYLPGQRTDSAWVIGAHYDHLGRIGEAVFWGANDNASGTAFLLQLAAYLKRHRPYWSVWVVAFGAEEMGLIGAKQWVAQPPYPLERLRGMLNFDLLGFGAEGLGVVGAADQPEFWQSVEEVRQRIGWTPSLLPRPNAPNSDHYPFRQAGVPALFFYLRGGPGYYHDIYDRPSTLKPVGVYPLFRWMVALLSQP
ncbi:MAG: M28 family peptidase [Bacteroidia bacterium]